MRKKICHVPELEKTLKLMNLGLIQRAIFCKFMQFRAICCNSMSKSIDVNSVRACTTWHEIARDCRKWQDIAVNEMAENDALSVVASNGIVRTNSP